MHVQTVKGICNYRLLQNNAFEHNCPTQVDCEFFDEAGLVQDSRAYEQFVFVSSKPQEQSSLLGSL